MAVFHLGGFLLVLDEIGGLDDSIWDVGTKLAFYTLF